MQFVRRGAVALLLCLVLIGAVQPLSVAAQPLSAPALIQTAPPTPTVPLRREPQNPLHAGDPAQYVFWAVPPVMILLIVSIVWWNRARRS